MSSRTAYKRRTVASDMKPLDLSMRVKERHCDDGDITEKPPVVSYYFMD